MEDKKLKILIADDEDGLRLSMAGILEMEGHEVFTAENGYEAVELAKQHLFDIAFLDIKMPGINGVDTFKGIKRYSPETVVFMITANAEQELIDQAISEGAYDIISKPFDMNMIIDTVQDSQKKTAILVVDDEKEFIDKTRQDLIKKGYKVISVSNEKQAKESFSRKAEEVVLVNIKGIVNSEEIFKKIKNITGEDDPRVIMINSCKVNGDNGEVITVGTRKLRDKNIDENSLKDSIHAILRTRQIPDKASIMIIDRDIELVNTMSVELGKHGYDVTAVSDCLHAVKQLETADFKLVLINPDLHKGECAARLEQLKLAKPDTEIVLLPSGTGESEKIEKYNFLYKPFDNAKVLAIIKEICEEKRKRESP